MVEIVKFGTLINLYLYQILHISKICFWILVKYRLVTLKE